MRWRAHCTTVSTGFELAQRSEGSLDLLGEDLRLFPRREVPALFELVVVDEFGIRLLRPALRSLIKLVRESADRNGNREVFGGEECQLAFPIQASRRDGRV